MAQVNFNYRVDMSSIASPSDPAGYIVAYDLDGVLKQKDYNGNVTLVGVIASQSIPYLFYNVGGSMSATNSTSDIYRTGSVNVGTGTATDGRFVVSSSGGTVSLIVDEYGSVYNKSRNNILTNLAFGLSASLSNTTGTNNTSFGNGALLTNTNKSFNLAIGSNALFNNNADYNIAIGSSSLFF